jgi:hypothetical protein
MSVKIYLSQDAAWYYQPEIEKAVGDAHPGNFLRDVTGMIVPIDLVIGHPAPIILQMFKSGAFITLRKCDQSRLFD